jgi:hypothetical protein
MHAAIRGQLRGVRNVPEGQNSQEDMAGQAGVPHDEALGPSNARLLLNLCSWVSMPHRSSKGRKAYYFML